MWGPPTHSSGVTRQLTVTEGLQSSPGLAPLPAHSAVTTDNSSTEVLQPTLTHQHLLLAAPLVLPHHLPLTVHGQVGQAAEEADLPVQAATHQVERS